MHAMSSKAKQNKSTKKKKKSFKIQCCAQDCDFLSLLDSLPPLLTS